MKTSGTTVFVHAQSQWKNAIKHLYCILPIAAVVLIGGCQKNAGDSASAECESDASRP